MWKRLGKKSGSSDIRVLCGVPLEGDSGTLSHLHSLLISFVELREKLNISVSIKSLVRMSGYIVLKSRCGTE